MDYVLGTFAGILSASPRLGSLPKVACKFMNDEVRSLYVKLPLCSDVLIIISYTIRNSSYTKAVKFSNTGNGCL